MAQPNLTRTPYRQSPTGRLGELLVASALLALTLPLMAIVAIAIKCDSPGPILVRQRKITPAGDHFIAVKFRTTVYGSGPLPNEEARYTTRVGWFLKLTRIENLPQLTNVLRGEMSCINPGFGCPFFLD